jgi:hypothetical protein
MINNSLSDRVILEFQEKYKDCREDISAVIFTPDNHLWLGTDETKTLECLSGTEANTFADHQRLPIADFIDLPNKSDIEIDIEGMDYADNYLWLVGSHSLKRKNVKSDKTDLENIERLATVEAEENRYLLARIPLVKGKLERECNHPEDASKKLTAARLKKGNNGSLLSEALAKDSHLGSFLNAKIPGKDNGFDIEGIAVYQNRIFLGLRGPVLRGWAIILEIEIEEVNSTRFKLKQKAGQLYKKHFVYLSGLGVRDLCWDGGDLLILAGPTMFLDGPVKIFRLNDALNLPENTLVRPTPVIDIPYGNEEDHAEGMTFFTYEGKRSLLVVYDSPAKLTRLTAENGVFADMFQF